jgi:hypothetical protein
VLTIGRARALGIAAAVIAAVGAAAGAATADPVAAGAWARHSAYALWFLPGVNGDTSVEIWTSEPVGGGPGQIDQLLIVASKCDSTGLDQRYFSSSAPATLTAGSFDLTTADIQGQITLSETEHRYPTCDAHGAHTTTELGTFGIGVTGAWSGTAWAGADVDRSGGYPTDSPICGFYAAGGGADRRDSAELQLSGAEALPLEDTSALDHLVDPDAAALGVRTSAYGGIYLCG